MHHRIPRLAAASALCLPLLAAAQTAGAAGDGARPLPYRSAFADYRPWQDAAPRDWRALNDALWSKDTKPEGARAATAPAAPGAASGASAPGRAGSHGPLHGGRP